MPSLIKALNSQVGRKIMTGITGIGLMLFLIGHLAGNFSIFGEAEAFNKYTHTLESLGPLLYLIEAGLAFFFLYHAILGISIWRQRKKARPEGYDTYRTKGGPSHQTLASKSMIYTGIIILVFLVLHIWHFKFGPSYTTMVDGTEMRDLRRLVIEEFTNPLVAFGYIGVLALAILHLAHGAWSAFTSLGMKHGETSKKVQFGAYIFAIVLMLGFIFIPLYIFLTGGEGSLIAY
ncbi:succinate dehydrogenase cytochrome b subunit [Gracilimonas mengyeensis]|uniref:Succinate dehydrogenase subunit C n=1 Tax=Gracilimonas mengyeensis TaxID=1302730 RepID=A0A521BAZ2_9BACT|nr:succinate dehydrogenase cytochrome b subunit [Gracilimonas mengyeensis]SMO44274.1 succinate dehydrogenase subunit C [Gracilimonas mengyeensis]